MEWIDIPALHLLRVTPDELATKFVFLDKDSNVIQPYNITADNINLIILFKRKEDGRIFKNAPVIPAKLVDSNYSSLYIVDKAFFLQEV